MLNKSQLPEPKEWTEKLREQYGVAEKFIWKKQRKFLIKDMPFSDMEHNPELDKYINSLTFVNKELQKCRFTGLQEIAKRY